METEKTGRTGGTLPDMLDVPGFPGYKVDRNADVWAFNHSKPRKLKVSPNGEIRLHRNGQQRAIKPLRILFAAEKGIDPSKLDCRLIITRDGRGKWKTVNKTEYVARAKQLILQNEAAEAEKRIDGCILFLEKVKRALAKDEWGEIYGIIYGLKAQVASYLHYSGLKVPIKTAEMYAEDAADIAAKAVTAGRLIPLPLAYMKRTAMRILQTDRKRRRSIDSGELREVRTGNGEDGTSYAKNFYNI